ncbi:MAG: lytic transglycosylase domain-containing protein [Spirochaetia bacterium]|nr:lytic transglycosylase domain-containing protein [Spirochaetia bacterium]
MNEIKPSAEDFNAALQKAFGDAENHALADAARDVPQKEKINRIADRYAMQYKVPPSLVKAVIEAESGYNTTAVSPKGAQGLMQLMPDTAEMLGVRDAFSPEENIRGGVSFMKNLLDRYGNDYKKALAAYNAGPGAVDKYGGVPDYSETKDYVDKVLKIYRANK